MYLKYIGLYLLISKILRRKSQSTRREGFGGRQLYVSAQRDTFGGRQKALDAQREGFAARQLYVSEQRDIFSERFLLFPHKMVRFPSIFFFSLTSFKRKNNTCPQLLKNSNVRQKLLANIYETLQKREAISLPCKIYLKYSTPFLNTL